MLKRFKFAAVSLILGLSMQGQASNPIGDATVMSDCVVMVFNEFGHEVPFPKGAIVTFPWDIIEGYWSALIREIPGMFSFRIDSSDPSQRKLKIIYFDQSRTRIIAEGIGLIDNEEKNVRGNLEGPNVSVAVVVTAYKLKDSGFERIELVTSIRLKGPSGKLDGNTYVIRKLYR